VKSLAYYAVGVGRLDIPTSSFRGCRCSFGYPYYAHLLGRTMISQLPAYTVSPVVIHEVLDDEAVLLNVESGVYFGLDATGTRIWQLLTSGLAVHSIVEQLLLEYDAHPSQVRDDVDRFLETLIENDLVRKTAW